ASRRMTKGESRNAGSIQRRLARRARFPTAMHPQPLVGILADVVFEDAVKERGVGESIGFTVAAAKQFQRRAELDAILAQHWIPDRKSWKPGSAGMERDTRDTDCRARRNPEEVCEHSLRWRHVRIHQDADCLVMLHG